MWPKHLRVTLYGMYFNLLKLISVFVFLQTQLVRPTEWQYTVLRVDQAELELISGTYCTFQTHNCSAHVCQSDCSVWFDRKWIPWKQDVATGVRHWKWSGKIIKEGASVNEGERLQRLFLYTGMCVLCPSLLEEVMMMMDVGRKREWGRCAPTFSVSYIQPLVYY